MVRSYRLSCRLPCRALRLAPALLALASALHIARAVGAELDGAAMPAAPAIAQRADPSQDVQVATLLNQQAAAVRSVAATQILNMQGRLQALHGDDAACDRALGHAKAVGSAAPARGEGAGPPVAAPIDVPLALCRRGEVAAAWSAGSLQVGDTDPRAGAGGFGFRSNGVTLGTDARLGSSLTLGVGLGLAHERAGAAHDATSNSADSVGAAAYASYRPSKHMFVDAMAGYGDLKMNSARRYGERGRIAAERRASEWFASLAAACQLQMAGTDFAPYTRVDVLRAALRGYTEADGSADALQFERQNLPSLKLAVGVTGTSRIQTRFGHLTPIGKVEWRHEMERMDAAPIGYAGDAAGAIYAMDASGSARDSLSMSLGATLAWRDDWSIGAGYAYDYSSNTRADRLDLMLSLRFR